MGVVLNKDFAKKKYLCCYTIYCLCIIIQIFPILLLIEYGIANPRSPKEFLFIQFKIFQRLRLTSVNIPSNDSGYS